MWPLSATRRKRLELHAQGAHIRQGDYNDAASLVAAFQGVATVLLISTSELDHALRVQQHRHAIDAAKQAGVRRVIYTSVVNPAPTSHFAASPGHFATEEYLRASGLAYTVFRNALYLDLVPMLVGAEAVSSGHIYFAAGEGKVSYALRADIAQALANALTTENHENHVYDIAAGPAYSMQDVAATLSGVTGQPVQYVAISGEDMAARMRQHHVPEAMIDLMSEMASALWANELNAPSPALEQLLGHAPTDLKTHLQYVYNK